MTLTEHKSPINKKRPNLLVKTDLLDFYSLTTMDSLQMKRSKVTFLWNCESPVNKLTEFDDWFEMKKQVINSNGE